MVDAVITWVDGEDPKHIEKRKQYDNSTRVKWTHPMANHTTRFANRDEIWYCIYSIRKFAPFINNIYLVTDQQCPGWLTEDLQNKLNVTTIDHSVIFQGYEQYLPTFNSRTIETMIYRIPGLDDDFLYFNDDFILINPCRETDYFDKGKLVYRGEWMWKLNMKRRLINLFPLDETNRYYFLADGYVGYRGEDKYFKRNKYMLFRLAHTPHPMNKKICEQLFLSQEDLESQIKYKFKNKQQYCSISLGANLAFKNKKAKKGNDNFGYLAGNKLNKDKVNKWINYFEQKSSIKSICIQSLDQANPAVEERIKAFLHERLEI